MHMPVCHVLQRLIIYSEHRQGVQLGSSGNFRVSFLQPFTFNELALPGPASSMDPTNISCHRVPNPLSYPGEVHWTRLFIGALRWDELAERSHDNSRLPVDRVYLRE
ncbi:hypothetical protein PGTUg99_030872 [Puccinia graminis f. sp. tritici]|uniref:Uncharacterized protein n=1 Tax=Puccinia graminis f. sp. tritici TaxID=56615 RepID=A0A5B0MA07_PUCGR|nr:hypothetical protein PGTUg99_030872 [Puccinia graminis f. sp. tritici]